MPNEQMSITYKVNDASLDALTFIEMANQVWPGNYHVDATEHALKKTINITAWDGDVLVGCVRILTDGAFFGTITEILVLPHYQKRGIGKKLMRLVEVNTPTRLFFGAQPQAIGFYERLGYDKSLQSFVIKKPAQS